MKIKRIGIIGCVADGKDMYDGQTVSTRLWRDEMNRVLPGKSVCVVDTYQYKKRAISVLWQWVKCIFTCSHIVIMLSGNGLYFFLPLFYYANKLFHRKIYHRVIGGELDAFLERNPECLRYMNALEVNWVQSHALAARLAKMGMTNAAYLENFRNITPIELPPEPEKYEKPFRFCTFSRVSKAKGISLAIEAVAAVNEQLGEGTATLDVYGPVEPAYAEEFYGLTEKHSDCVKYMGSVPSGEAVQTLKNYYMHLFPTTWSGEGFPGTLIDCYNAGLPTIASDWAYNAEYLEEGRTGYLYDWQRPELLHKRIAEAISHPDETYEMRKCCIAEAGKYQCDTVVKKIIDWMEA